MNLITATYCDYLTPNNGVVNYYDKFVSRYTAIVTSTLVSQCNLMPEMFNEEESVLDEHIDRFISSIPENALRQREMYRTLLMGMMLDAGEVRQESEDRTFVSESFLKQAQSSGISSRKLVIRTLNAYAFLNYFFLLEETIRDAYLEVINDESKSLGGIKTISYCLKRKLEHDDKLIEFENELRERSKFFNSFRSLATFWELLNFIRNRQAHYNGIYDTGAQERLSELFEVFIKQNSCNDNLVADVSFNSTFDNIIDSVKETGQLIFNDTLENIIRNTSVFIMESLYVVETTN
ncbi:hypothetical protein [Vibrio vulnificus]|uniref:hypothetical protein n=1 Tax=Vibrio vulnificus TaxID=672 RepID=UPI0005F229F5|nr:hypothetical protein [Vibrio vulnificus]MCU8308921.1 hypothetical protein [Vibrio vulnificus]